MKSVAPAICYALFVWWFTTGLVFLLVLRRRATVLLSVVGAALLFPVCLYLLGTSSGQTSLFGVYEAFTAAIVLWGTQEIAFLSGFVTGPRVSPCPPDAKGWDRVGYAIQAILYHEISLIVSALATVAVTWNEPNHFGALTFLVLYVMRVSAKLNLFLGVPVLNDEIMPREILYLRTYFRRGPVNAFFPVAVSLSVLMTVGFVGAALDADASRATTVGYALVGALTALAILEHVFMLVQLRIDRLWRWSTRRRGDDAGPSHDAPMIEHPGDSVVATRS